MKDNKSSDSNEKKNDIHKEVDKSLNGEEEVKPIHIIKFEELMNDDPIYSRSNLCKIEIVRQKERKKKNY